MAHSEPDLQTFVDRFAEATQFFGRTIRLSKTKLLYQPAPGTTTHPPKVSIAGTESKAVDHFRYLGNVTSLDISLAKETAGRISKASQSLSRLSSGIMNHRNIKLSAKIKVYKAVVLTSLLYSCKTSDSFSASMRGH